jgi:hypothetical protein
MVWMARPLFHSNYPVPTTNAVENLLETHVQGKMKLARPVYMGLEYRSELPEMIQDICASRDPSVSHLPLGVAARVKVDYGFTMIATLVIIMTSALGPGPQVSDQCSRIHYPQQHQRHQHRPRQYIVDQNARICLALIPSVKERTFHKMKRRCNLE